MKSKSEHHSVVDWDFSHSTSYRALSADHYVSSPTSIKFFNPGGGDIYHSCLCRLPATLCLPQGEIRTWRRNQTASGNILSFRNQAPLGTSNYLNCYFLYFTGTYALIRRYVGGGPTDFTISPCPSSANVWEHWRVFWYNGKTPGDADAICVDLYKEISGEWVKQGNTAYDTANRWKDSAINRTGLAHQARSYWTGYFDDTEIWGPV